MILEDYMQFIMKQLQAVFLIIYDQFSICLQSYLHSSAILCIVEPLGKTGLPPVGARGEWGSKFSKWSRSHGFLYKYFESSSS